jgi:hypothetical protein
MRTFTRAKTPRTPSSECFFFAAFASLREMLRFLLLRSLRPLRLNSPVPNLLWLRLSALWPYAVFDVFVRCHRRYCAITGCRNRKPGGVSS